MPGPRQSGYVLPTDNPAPISTEGGQTNDAVTRLLVEKYDVPPDQAAALANRYAAGVPDEGLTSQALGDVADREIKRLKRIDFYVKAKQDILAGRDPGAGTRKYVEAVDAEHKRLVQERAAAATQTAAPAGAAPSAARPTSFSARNADEVRAKSFNREYAKTHPGVQAHGREMVFPGYAGAPQPDFTAAARSQAEDRATKETHDWAQSHPGAVQHGRELIIPPPGHYYQRVDQGRYADTPAEMHPVVRTAYAAMTKFGADPTAAANFALQLHGIMPEGE